jgi:two-component system, chemotaxis family, chemotaxis protein CheY
VIPASSVRVMIVDDEPAMRRLTRRSLQHVGIREVFEASDGDEALELVRLNRVHIIVADYQMPNMNGLQLLQNLRTDSKLAKVGFILLSGVADAAVARRAEQLGADGFIMKPFSLADLQQRLDALFRRLTGRNIAWS